MATIYKPPKKVYKRVKEDSKRNNINHKAVYNTTTWRSIRLEKLKKDPLCEDCLLRGVVTSGIEVHHVTPLSHGKTIKDKQMLGFDKANLRTLCKQCHKETHDDNNRKNDLHHPQY